MSPYAQNSELASLYLQIFVNKIKYNQLITLEMAKKSHLDVFNPEPHTIHAIL